MVKTRELSSYLFNQGIVAVLLGLFIVIALVAMFTASRELVELEWIGMTVHPLAAETARAHGIPNDRGGLIVEEVEGLAARAGVREGDVLLSINGAAIRDLADFSHITGKTALQEGVLLEFLRNGARTSLLVPGKKFAGPLRPLPHMGGRGRRWLGVEAETFSPAEGRELGIPGQIQGVLIDGVAANSRAARAGLRPNDVIVSVNGRKINTTADLWGILSTLSLTTPLNFDLYRQGKFISVFLPGDSRRMSPAVW